MKNSKLFLKPIKYLFFQSEQQKRLQNMSAKPDEYVELIAQCEANPGKFLGTQYCLRLVLGTQPLEEFIRQRAWGKEQLKEWDITWGIFN